MLLAATPQHPTGAQYLPAMLEQMSSQGSASVAPAHLVMQMLHPLVEFLSRLVVARLLLPLSHLLRWEAPMNRMLPVTLRSNQVLQGRLKLEAPSQIPPLVIVGNLGSTERNKA